MCVRKCGMFFYKIRITCYILKNRFSRGLKVCSAVGEQLILETKIFIRLCIDKSFTSKSPQVNQRIFPISQFKSRIEKFFVFRFVIALCNGEALLVLFLFPFNVVIRVQRSDIPFSKGNSLFKIKCCIVGTNNIHIFKVLNECCYCLLPCSDLNFSPLEFFHIHRTLTFIVSRTENVRYKKCFLNKKIS